MKYFVVFPLLLLSVYAKCQNSTNDIYLDIIENYKSKEYIVIDDSTSIYLPEQSEAYFIFIKELMPRLQDETLNAFLRNNKQKLKLHSDQFETDVKLVFLSKSEKYSIITNGNGWGDFYEKYGNDNCILTLSVIGFNKSNTQALVYLGNWMNFKAAAGYLLLFEFENGVWKRINKCQIWIS